MKRQFLLAAVGAFGVVLSGCVSTTTDSGYKFDGVPKYEEKSLAMTELVEQILSDPCFSEMYEEAKKVAAERENKLPIIAIKAENNTRAGASDRALSQIVRELQIALRRTKKFKIIDYSLIGTGPSTDGNPEDYFVHDFLMHVEITIEDGAYYFLNAQMTGIDDTIAIDGSVRFRK